MYISFEVKEQLIKRIDEKVVVADSQNYLKARFTFTNDWVDVIKTAVFKQGENVYNVLLENDECLVPYEVILSNGFNVSVFGGNLITANVVFIPVIPSGLENGVPPSPPTEDVYNQILDTVEETQKEITSIRYDLDGINDVLDEINGEAL